MSPSTSKPRNGNNAFGESSDKDPDTSWFDIGGKIVIIAVVVVVNVCKAVEWSYRFSYTVIANPKCLEQGNVVCSSTMKREEINPSERRR